MKTESLVDRFNWDTTDIVIEAESAESAESVEDLERDFAADGEPLDTRTARYGKWEKETNAYQGLLVAKYDAWAEETAKVLRKAQRDNVSAVKLAAILDGRLAQLGGELNQAGREKLLEAFRLGLVGKAPDAAGLKLVADKILENERYIAESLVPKLRGKLLTDMHLLGTLPLTADIVSANRSMVAPYAGGYWSMIFEGRRMDGKQETEDRQAAGLKPRRVRWMLDPTAQHCAPSAGRFGCPELAHEYESWDALPTLPASGVTCLNNCRCWLEVQDDNGEWVRV